MTNGEDTVAERVATVHNDLKHMSGHIDRLEGTIDATRKELKSD